MDRLTKALRTVEKALPAMTLGMLTTFLFAAQAAISDLALQTGHSFPTVARQVDLLGEGIAGRPGLGLLAKFPVPEKRSMRYVVLAVRGKVLVDLLSGDLSAAQTPAPLLDGNPLFQRMPGESDSDFALRQLVVGAA